MTSAGVINFEKVRRIRIQKAHWIYNCRVYNCAVIEKGMILIINRAAICDLIGTKTRGCIKIDKWRN